MAVNYSNNVRGHSFNTEAQRTTENSLFRIFLGLNSYYILQNEAAEMSILEGMANKNQTAFERDLQTVARIFDCGDEMIGLRSYVLRMRMFYNIQHWVGAMRTMTASVGTRFHGNIAAILSGTPALILAHDMRTREMAELFSIPHLLLDRDYSANEVLERLMDADYEPFARRLGELRSEWRMFSYRNGIG